VDPLEDAEVWVSTSEDGGATFAPPRRLGVSTTTHNYYPCLQRTPDGLHRLVWLGNLGDSALARLWTSASADLLHWDWPRRVRMAHLSSSQEGFNRGIGLGTDHAAACPQLLEGSSGETHLFVTAWGGPGGPGLYHLTTTDFAEWSRPARIGGQGALGCAARLPDGSFLVACRAQARPLELWRLATGGGARPVATTGLPGVSDTWRILRPVLVRVPDGTLHLWDAVAPAEYGLFRSADGSAWTGPLTRVRGPAPADVLVGKDGEVLTLLEDGYGAFLHRWRAR
jgi:hypothetical protein